MERRWPNSVRHAQRRGQQGFHLRLQKLFKTSTSKVRSDHCEVVGLIIHYDDGGHVEYIEITKPHGAPVTLELFGTDVTNISVEAAFKLLRAHSPEHTKDEYGYDFPGVGINVYNHDLESEDQPVECFGISAKP